MMSDNAGERAEPLPVDRCGVHVDNKLDEKRLAYLLSQVDEKKIRQTAIKYTEKYPGSKIYVSRLLKIYRIRVPANIYVTD